ncbi:alpha/beta fold hydrolase [Kordiimonas sp. SCSIO 12603]|uniref:alpha/beta fold hydrolase n=1 Tax=Kordiimonas sp. SCSIO 12603 TaxID=2829596 RepID=UPI002104A7FB|nr:alpha/beta hydrolase [Kordiimonas sp. SCSIO 12603]UTW59547.1 alpha/beta fold hydrolase [Kordiimonas sp. SCSIO 12603]
MRILLLLSLILGAQSAFSQPDAEQSNPYGHGQYLETPRGKIYYETEGSGTPVFIVNGGPGAGHRVFLGWFEFLKTKGYQIVYFDEIGRGRSERNIKGKFTPQMTVDDMEALRAHLNAEKIVVMGHSYGGIPAMQYAIQFPEHVERLVMLSASYDAQSQQMNIDHVSHLMKTKYPEIHEQVMALRAKGMLSSEDEYLDLIYESALGRELQWFNRANRKGLWKYRSNDKRDRFNFQVYLDIIGEDPEWEITGTLKGLTVEDKLRGFNIPTLILGGRADKVSTPELVYRLYKMLPEQTTQFEMFEKSGHWIWAEENEKFKQVVSNFLPAK